MVLYYVRLSGQLFFCLLLSVGSLEKKNSWLKCRIHAHMRYVKNGEYPSHITLTTFTRFAQNSTIVSVLALYGSTMHIATL